VARPVQDKILDICARHLAPHGVAFISYNTFPGWHTNILIRDMLLYHVRRFAQPQERANQARALLNFLAEATAQQQNTFSSLLKDGLEHIRKVDNYYVVHDYLENVNEPLYFHQFVERLTGRDLQYLAEAEVHAMVAVRFPPAVVRTLETL